MKVEKIGMRTIKTALAASLTIFIARTFNLRSPFFAGIAAIISMQSSVSESLNAGIHRMYGTIIGAIVALVFSLIAPENAFFMGIGIMIIIYICNILKLKKSVTISTIVFQSIILNYQEGSRVSYALYRTLDTLIGLVIGTLINYFILPPNMENKIKASIHNMYFEIKNMLEGIIWEEDHISLENLKEDLIDIEKYYNIFKKDTKLNLCKTDDCVDFEQIFEVFENIYNHLSIICSVNQPPYINHINKMSLENLFNKEIPTTLEKDKDDLYLIYNYHLEKILDKLSFIQNTIEPIKSLTNSN